MNEQALMPQYYVKPSFLRHPLRWLWWQFGQ